MQGAETVPGVIRERGRRGLPLEWLCRRLSGRGLFLRACGRVYPDAGSMTPGVTEETVEGMSLAKIGAIIGALRSEWYRWSPAGRVCIGKKGPARKRPLSVPSWPGKLVAEVVRVILGACCGVRFSGHSHGFRPGGGCHAAVGGVTRTWAGTRWFTGGDIAGCSGTLDRPVMVSALAERIHDGRFLQLIERMLPAGYVGDFAWHATLSGAPRGGIASPALPASARTVSISMLGRR
jgi:retron-type reverse transcriptase